MVCRDSAYSQPCGLNIVTRGLLLEEFRDCLIQCVSESVHIGEDFGFDENDPGPYSAMNLVQITAKKKLQKDLVF